MEFLDATYGLFARYAHLGIPVVAVFARMSIFMLLLPGVGEISVPPRMRLIIAALMTGLLVPLVAPISAATPMSISDLFVLIIQQMFYGFLLGFSLRVFVFGLQITGNIISQSMSLSQIFGEGITTEPNTTLSTLFMLSGITLALTSDLHIYAFGVFTASFDRFPIGADIAFDEAAFWATQTFQDIYNFSITLGAPFLILSFVYNLILGFVNRAMPQLMVSFVGMPAITGTGIFLLVLSSGSLLLIWLKQYQNSFGNLLS